MKRVLLAILLLTASLTGCISSDDAPGQADAPGEDPLGRWTPNPRTALADCPTMGGINCFETSVATVPTGEILVTNSECTEIARAPDSTLRFEALAAPPLPPQVPPDAMRADCTLDVGPEGRLFFSALVLGDTIPGLTRYGIHVARSADAGDSWETTTFLSLADQGSSAIRPDRPWLAFGSDDRVHLTYWQWREVEGQAYLATSEDGGDSFRSFREMPGYGPGDPVAEDEGTVHVPTFDAPSGESYEVQIRTTTDGGQTFDTRTVYEGEPRANAPPWPSIARTSEGGFVTAWVNGQGQVLVAQSTGGTGPADPVIVNANETSAAPVPPKLLVHDELVHVAWYREATDGTQAYMLARAPRDQLGAGFTTWTVERFEADGPVTHYADLTSLPDGRSVLAWTNPAAGLRVDVGPAPPASDPTEPVGSTAGGGEDR